MFKRGSEGSAPPAKGGPGSQAEEKSDPIPRHIPTNSVTLNFVQRGWTEIAPGEMYYLPMCQTPKYMFDDANINLFNKFKDLWYTMEIHNPMVKLSNLIMLQDDLRVQNNTPTDATAFTQVNYLCEMCPKGKKQYYKLKTTTDGSITGGTNLKYKLQTDKPTNPFVKLQGFSAFDNTLILPAKANVRAGFTPGAAVTVNANTGTVTDVYIAPNTSTTAFQIASGNLNPSDDTKTFYKEAEVITRMSNEDSICFHKYGDTIEIPITTNLEGLHLANIPENNFLADVNITMPNPASPKQTLQYGTEFCWPSRNRPFLSRGSYYDQSLNPILNGKKFKELEHHFFAMPPIKKPGGELLGQRCSMFCEQSMSVTFHFTQGTFGLDADDMLMTHQDSQIQLRRNIYPTPIVSSNPDPANEQSVFCKKGNAMCRKQDAENLKCYDNSFPALVEFIDDVTRDNPEHWQEMFTFSSKRPGPCPTDVQIPTFIKPSTTQSAVFQKRWETWIEGKNYNWLCFRVEKPERRSGARPGQGKWVYWVNSDNTPIVWQGDDLDEPPTYVHLHKEKFLELFFAKGKTFCDNEDQPIANADINKDCLVFFT